MNERYRAMQLATSFKNLLPPSSPIVRFNLPVSGLAGTGFLGGTPFYSYRWSFSKKKAPTAWMRRLFSLSLSVFLGAFQASEQKADRLPLGCCGSQSVSQPGGRLWSWRLEDWERRENLPGAELTAPVTVCPIKAQEAGLADRVISKC